MPKIKGKIQKDILKFLEYGVPQPEANIREIIGTNYKLHNILNILVKQKYLTKKRSPILDVFEYQITKKGEKELKDIREDEFFFAETRKMFK